MKRIVIIASSVAALLLTGACTRLETVKNDPLKTKIYTLDNGLKVYMSVNKEEPRIQTYIAVRAGGKNGPDESTGLAHYFEHLMFKGTEQFGTSDYAAEKPLLDEIEVLFETYRRTTDEAERAALYHRIDSLSYEASKISIPNEYDKLMACIGAKGTNAWTSMDETVYTEDIPSNQIDSWARIQADRFKNIVIRGFHTELETIYEEKNMSLTKDSRKLWEALDASLFPDHPYGTRTVLGTQEHLKNPSITDVKAFHDAYYVPNNVAICVAGDFNPKEMVKTIEKYFGDWKPNPSVPLLEVKPFVQPKGNVVKEVYGLEAEMLCMGWALPGARDLKSSAVSQIAEAILCNGQSGLFDLGLVQQQKVLSAYGGASIQPDYGEFILFGSPKEGQSLDEVRDLMLGQLERLRSGDFDESLIESTVNNLRLEQMIMLEHNEMRAHNYVNAFINDIPWADAAASLDRIASVTKEDVVSWASSYLTDNSYAIVYKRKGTDDSVQKISAPAITPIATNRDCQSDFLTEIQNAEVKPIEPVFVDFSKDMAKFEVAPGVEALYKHNDLNGTFNLDFVVNTGIVDDPALGVAFDYLSYLGTADMSAEDIASRMYELACSYSFRSGDGRTTLSLSGLAENMDDALAIMESLIFEAVGDEAVLENLKADMFKARADSKLSQRACFSALQEYVMYGPEYVTKTTITNDAGAALTSDELLAKVRGIFGFAHRAVYYGPLSQNQFKSSLLANHRISGSLTPKEEVNAATVITPDNAVVMCQYDAKQIYYMQYSNRGEAFDPASAADISLYNEYFGGGMNSIVFQEMREARGLAYSAMAELDAPAFKDGSYSFLAFIATQNDKMQQAMEAFDDIINNMPESEAAFSIAKDGILSRLRTRRVNGKDVLNEYQRCERMGLAKPLSEDVFNKVQNMTLEDVKAAQEKWVKGRNYSYMILGDIADLDTGYLQGIAPVRTVSLEEIFGF